MMNLVGRGRHTYAGGCGVTLLLAFLLFDGDRVANLVHDDADSFHPDFSSVQLSEPEAETMSNNSPNKQKKKNKQTKKNKTERKSYDANL